MVCLEESKGCSEERQISAHLRGEESEVYLQLIPYEEDKGERNIHNAKTLSSFGRETKAIGQSC